MKKIVYGNAKDGEFFAHLSDASAKEYRKAKKAKSDAERAGNAIDVILANREFNFAFRKCELENELNYQKSNIDYWNAEPRSELVSLRISDVDEKISAIQNALSLLEEEKKQKSFDT